MILPSDLASSLDHSTYFTIFGYLASFVLTLMLLMNGYLLKYTCKLTKCIQHFWTWIYVSGLYMNRPYFFNFYFLLHYEKFFNTFTWIKGKDWLVRQVRKQMVTKLHLHKNRTEILLKHQVGESLAFDSVSLSNKMLCK